MKQSFFFDIGSLAPQMQAQVDRKSGVRTARKRTGRSSPGKEYNCETCGLYRSAKTPRMEPWGDGELGIVIVGEAPGAQEDDEGRPFCGRAGKKLRLLLEPFGVEVERDCTLMNIAQCRPPENKLPSIAPRCCEHRWSQQLIDLRPSLILAMGMPSSQALVGVNRKISLLRGQLYVHRKFRSWLGSTFHPAFLLRANKPELEQMFNQDVRAYISLLSREDCFGILEHRLEVGAERPSDFLTDFDAAKEFLEKIGAPGRQIPVTFDYETNMLSPFEAGCKLLCVSLACEEGINAAIPIDMECPEGGMYWTLEQREVIVDLVKRFLESDGPKVCQNSKFEALWSREYLGSLLGGHVADTMIDQHIIDDRADITGLEWQVRKDFGVSYKGMVNRKKMGSEPPEQVALYCNMDSRFTSELNQDTLRNEGLEGKEPARELFTEGQMALARVERAGICVDVEAAHALSEGYGRQLGDLTDEMLLTKPAEMFYAERGKDPNFNSSDQLGTMLFEMMRYTPPRKKSEAGHWPVDEGVLEKFQDQEPLCELLLKYRKLDKLKSTYIDGVLKVVADDGKIHPTFNLHIGRTYRGSCTKPNVQNQPKRAELGYDMRRIYIPSPGNKFLEVDRSGSEIAVMAMYSKDPCLIEDLENGVDLHRFWASEIYEVSEGAITGKQRFHGKNSFVFPLFYGAGPELVSRAIPGVSFRQAERLVAKFWKRYSRIKEFQKEILQVYEADGVVNFFLGFQRCAPLSITKVINTPIQGTAFHLLLAALNELVLRLFPKHGFKSRIVNEIHDSMLIDTVPEEQEELMGVVEWAMTDYLTDRFDFVNVPLGIGWEEGSNWRQMEELKEAA